MRGCAATFRQRSDTAAIYIYTASGALIRTPVPASAKERGEIWFLSLVCQYIPIYQFKQLNHATPENA